MKLIFPNHSLPLFPNLSLPLSNQHHSPTPTHIEKRSFSRSSHLNPTKWLYHCRVHKCEGCYSQKIKFEVVVCKKPKLQDYTWQKTQKNIKRKFVEKI